MTRLQNLSHIDFEDLCRDLLQAETGERFSAFAPGPDGGIDGRHSKGSGTTVLQCKHYVKSSFSKLKSAAKREIPKLEVLKPEKYYFFTSYSLSPTKQDELAAALAPYLCNSEDVWGLDDIEAAIRRNPDVEKSHIKLWLSSTAVLDKILNSGLEQFTHATKDELIDKLKVYVRNPSLDAAMKKLETEKTLVVSGPPGVGKTTLAYMVSYQYLSEGWRFVAINSLEDGFTKIDEATPTVFFFDDFLGRIELDRQALLQRDNQLAMFVGRVRRSKNARFILTTRAHIFEEARNISDRIDDGRLQLSKYLLDVGAYTRKVKSQIFYNHLEASGLSQEHYNSLLDGSWLKKIVDHKNYNPRIIAQISSDSLEKIEANTYPSYIVHALDNPNEIWDKPFRNLDIKSQNLLIALFFGGQFGQHIENLRQGFSLIHRQLSNHYGHPTKPDDFEQTLKSLESGFISISHDLVHFVNPSVRDYLKSHLVDIDMLKLLATLSERSDWASSVWAQMKYVAKKNGYLAPWNLKDIASLFTSFAEKIDISQSLIREESRYGYMTISADDLCLSDRAKLLVNWWECTENDFFLERCLHILKGNRVEIDEGRDCSGLLELNACEFDYIDFDHPLKDELRNASMQKLFLLMDGGIATDSLAEFAEALKEYETQDIPAYIHDKLDELVAWELDDPHESMSHLSTESEISEHIELVERIAQARDVDAAHAVNVASEKLAEIEEPDYGEYRSSYRSSGTRTETFSDEDLNSMFSTLLQK